jgi:hypothetical protein
VRHSFYLAALLSALLTPVSAWSFEITQSACFKTVTGEKPMNRGIATPGLAKRAFIQLCNGSWKRVQIQDNRMVLEIAKSPINEAARPADILPDGHVTRSEGRVAKAWLSGATGIYSHGILGDPTEASAINVVTANGKHFTHKIDQQSVFEDLRVRVIDLDGDRNDELVVIRSYLDEGSALSVFRLAQTAIELRAETPPIGLSYRWLNPAGAADFDGDGKVEIAYVETPHIGGTLRVYQLGADGLHQEYEAPGFSNHKMGSRQLDMSAVVDWNGDGVPDLALPNANRRRIHVVGFAGGKYRFLAKMERAAEIVTRILATDLDNNGTPELLYGRADGP